MIKNTEVLISEKNHKYNLINSQQIENVCQITYIQSDLHMLTLIRKDTSEEYLLLFPDCRVSTGFFVEMYDTLVKQHCQNAA